MSFSSLRIIGGKWRGRRILFPSVPRLRPTHDRIRETAFNWLQHDIIDSVCLDLFAGSGAFGFEALSRGAKEVIFVDSSLSVISALQKNLQTLQASNAAICYDDFKKIVTHFPQKKFDIVFLDPPFRKNLLIPVCQFLEKNECLNIHALIYIEVEKNAFFAGDFPPTWEVIRHQSTKTLEYGLCRRLPHA